MLQDIIEVQTRENYQLYLKFEDGNAGIIDISQMIEFTGIFEALKDLDYFKTVKLNPEWGTIYSKGSIFSKGICCLVRCQFSSNSVL
ncbi:MAG: DUF2442 domain-containing protein [Cyanobacteria bacterium P01_G01_bin.49]